MKAVYSILALLILMPVWSQNYNFQKIDSLINSKVSLDHPGIGVGIIKNGTIIYEKYRGLSNLQHQINFDENTRSNIASTAKQFTALMILQLHFEEKLNLEDDIRKYLTNLYPNVKEAIKIRNLLNHTSGIRDYVELLDLEGNVWWQRFGYGNNDVLALIEQQQELGFSPGSEKYYSNSNYNLLAKIIEVVSQQSFNEYSNAFFKKLNMPNTSFVERYMKVIPNRANPYSDWGRGEWWEVPTVTKTNGEGFLFTTLKDQLTYEIIVQNAKIENNKLILESQKSIPNSIIKAYGYGLELTPILNRKAVHHSGGTYGFHSQVFRFPDENLSIFILSNNGNISSNLIAKEIAKILLKPIAKEEKYNPDFYSRKSLSKPSNFLGQYRSPSGVLTRVIEEEGKLYFRQKKYLKIKLVPEKEKQYHLEYDKTEKVVFYDNELAVYSANGKTSTYEKISDKKVSKNDIPGFIGDYYNNELNISFKLSAIDDSSIQLQFFNEKTPTDIEMFNRNEFLAGENFVLKFERDTFDRVIAIRMDYGRAKNILFVKKTKLQFQPKIQTEEGTIQVSTIGAKKGHGSQILLTKNKPNGNEIWYKTFGGNSYDKASSILETDDDYLIVGSTSSFGNGNYDMFVIKTDKNGIKQWQKAYGEFYNEYGRTAEITNEGYLIKGTQQDCPNNSDINRKCSTNVWFVSIDKQGNAISNKILEKIE